MEPSTTSRPDAIGVDAIVPMQLTPGDAPFTAAAWSFELLPRGYRMLAQCGEGDSALRSPRGVDTSKRFAEVTSSLDRLATRPGNHARCVFDGEVCAFDRAGRNDAARLHRRGVQRDPAEPGDELTYCIFDLLVHEGRDLRGEPWWRRRRLLESLQLHDTPRLCLQRSLPVHGEWLFRQAVALGRAGIAARRRDAAYQSGPSSDWRWIANPELTARSGA